MKLKLNIQKALITALFFIINVEISQADTHLDIENKSNPKSFTSTLTAVGSVNRPDSTGNLTLLTPVVYTSRDGGINWTIHILEQADQHSRLDSVTCGGHNGQYCTAVGIINGGNPLIYTSIDGGENWTPHTLDQSNQNIMFAEINCNGDNNQYCVAVGAIRDKSPLPFLASTFTSTDGGISWTPHILTDRGSIAWLTSISCNGNNNKYCMVFGMYRGENKIGQPESPIKLIAYRTEDGGNNWLPHKILTFDSIETNISSVDCNGDTGQYCTAVGYFGQVNDLTPITYTSSDNGFYWAPYVFMRQYDTSEIHSVHCDNDNGQYCVAVGETFTDVTYTSSTTLIAYTSTNGGLSWAQHVIGQLQLNTRGQLNAITCTGVNNQHCVTIGTIADSQSHTTPISYTSDDGGNNWIFHDITKENNFNMDIRSISAHGGS